MYIQFSYCLCRKTHSDLNEKKNSHNLFSEPAREFPCVYTWNIIPVSRFTTVAVNNSLVVANTTMCLYVYTTEYNIRTCCTFIMCI